MAQEHENEQKLAEGTGERETTGKEATEQEAGPVLMDVDDSRSGRFKMGSSLSERLEPAWKPGIVEVEFKEADIPRSMLARCGPSGGSAKDVGQWPEELRQILDRYGFVRWERTFPTSYPWSKENAARSPLAQAIESDRDRFITFYFPQDADVAFIADEMEQARPVARAAPVPGLVPPSPLAEPLTGTDDQVNVEHLCTTPTNCLQNQWYIFRCGVNHAWQLLPGGVSGRNVVVADIDWGFRTTHIDLLERIKFQFNTIKDNEIVSNGTEIPHGTAVLGLAGAAANGFGMVGFAYESDLWAIQAGDNVTKDHKFWVEAIDLVRDKDSAGCRKVIVLEIQTENHLGNIEQSVQISQAIKNAIQAGVVVCVAAGNAGKNAALDDNDKEFPETGSILVGATKFNQDSSINERADSNWGERVVVYAPGDRIHDVTCCSGNIRGYRHDFGGTSSATAKVAGTVALMLQVNDKLRHEDIRDILRQTGSSITDDPSKPPGVFLNAKDAVNESLKRAHSV